MEELINFLRELDVRLKRIERHLALADANYITGAIREKLEESKRNGESIIPAIKLYREMTGAGLREAKDAVELIRDRMN